MLEASIAPSAAPAPMTVWISSINNMIFPAALTSSSAFFILSSNSPRYFEPATMADKSSEKIRLSFSVSGTSPSLIFCAKPSTMAVLPTPGSPIKQGLFFVLRLRIRMMRSISCSLPTMGSNLPWLANAVMSRLNLSKSSVSETSSSGRSCIPNTPAGCASLSPSSSIISSYKVWISTPKSSSNVMASVSGSRKSAKRICSVPT